MKMSFVVGGKLVSSLLIRFATGKYVGCNGPAPSGQALTVPKPISTTETNGNLKLEFHYSEREARKEI